MNRYAFKQGVELTAEFKNGASFIDPATVRLKLFKPDGSSLTYVYGLAAEVLRDDVGRYRFKFVPDQEDRWFYRWEAENPESADEKEFKVLDSVFY